MPNGVHLLILPETGISEKQEVEWGTKIAVISMTARAELFVVAALILQQAFQHKPHGHAR